MESKPIEILLVEDNPGDARLAVEALNESKVRNNIHTVSDGVEALQAGAEDYLVKGHGDGELIARSIRYAIERKRAKEHLAYLTQFDHLTGLANRGLLQDRLERAVVRADRVDGMVALMFLNLDRFQAVNDTFGEDYGDELLKLVAERLQRCVREADTVARVGGDEFAVVAEGLAEAQEALPIAQNILGTLSQPFSLNGREVFMTASVGIAVRPPSEMDVLLKDAGAAMHRAREQGRNTYRFYADEMNLRAEEYLVLQSDLRRALEREEFVLHYQPQVEVQSGRIVGAEALLRWQHAERGLISPADFIPILEESGLIVDVGEWVLRTACTQSKKWREAGLSPVRMAVNISARQFAEEGLGRTVVQALNEAGLDPSCLELELTESLVMSDPQYSSDILNGLRQQMEGLQVSIDDFGTGYSSLSYLTKFPLDVLKIDRSFVGDVPGDGDAEAIISGIIGLAHSLRLTVIAEGIETEEQLNLLREGGCDQAQGFYFSKPVPAEDFAALSKTGEPLRGVQV
ncbi:hypothetical protein BH23ACT11_BH23ACT11_15080 [soil metagenome]